MYTSKPGRWRQDLERPVLGQARLSRKLLAGLGAGLGLASLLFLGLIVETYRVQLSQERGNASEQVNRLLQVSLENAMLKRDLPGLQDIVKRLGQQPGIAGVTIINPSGEVRFSSDPVKLHTKLRPDELNCAGCEDGSIKGLSRSTQLVTATDGREVLRSVNPISNRAECAGCHGLATSNPINGVLIVDHDGGSIRREALKAAGLMSAAGILVMLLGLGTVWLVLKRHVLRPVLALDGASRALASGNLGARVQDVPSRDDELADLCRTFNVMAGQMEHAVGEIRQKEQFLKALIDTVPDGVRVIDENYAVVMVNGAYARQAQADPSAVVGVPCYAIHGRTERCAPTLVTCPFHAITADGEPIKYVHRHVRADGSALHVETTAARLTIEKDGARRVLIIEAIRDLEQQAKYSHEQRLSEIGQLAAGVAHEIYNPLASVRLGLQAVLRRAESEEKLTGDIKTYLGMVDGEVDKCIRVTKRLLDLSQVPSQSMQLVSLSTIIPEILSLLCYEAEQRQVQIDHDLGDEDLRVLATDAELRMLALNLAQNAFHAMPKGGTLTVTGGHDAGQVIVRFADTGVGIAPEVRDHIFDPFYSRRADGVPGTGLGLTICKSIASRYQGRIEVKSEVGAGAVFSVMFPRPDAGGSRS